MNGSTWPFWWKYQSKRFWQIGEKSKISTLFSNLFAPTRVFPTNENVDALYETFIGCQ